MSEGDWRVLDQWTGDMQPITYNAGRPVQTTLRLPIDRRNGIKADTGIFLQDRWTMSRVTWNLGVRYDWLIGETQDSEVTPSRFNNGIKVREMRRTETMTPAQVASARCRTGRTSRRDSAWQ